MSRRTVAILGIEGGDNTQPSSTPASTPSTSHPSPSVAIKPIEERQKMALAKKSYPKATLKKIIKAHSNRNIKKNADVTIFLNYVLFMENLVKEAAIKSKQAGDRGLTARSVRKVTRDTLAKFKG